MNIQQVLRKHSGTEIELLLSHLLGKPKEFLFLHPEYELTELQARRLSRTVRRRLKGEPIAYILGYKDFCGLRFFVNKNVLIPRPETEWAVEKIKDFIFKIKNGPIRILDVGTGSGCVAISVAKNFGNRAQVFASDVSGKALGIARKNARVLHAKVKFIQGDLLENIKFAPDIIIANLPYGWQEWKNNTSAETRGLKFEPKNALFTKESGLYQIRRLLEQISKLPQAPRLVYLEFDPRQKNILQKLIKKNLPKADIIFYKDLNRLWRFAEIKIL